MKRWIVCALAVGACSDDTGILVEVHGEGIQADIVRLETMVIVDDGGGDRPSGFDWGAAERIQADVGIDMHVEPYTVMLRPEGLDADAGVWVSALAYDENEALVGWGEVDGEVTFTSDVVKVVELDLHGVQVVGDGCIVKDDVVVVRNSDDCDQDQVGFDVDCDDLDASIGGDLDGDPVVCDNDCDQSNGEIYPGALEECDGIDNDCDPFSAPRPHLCVDVVREGKTVLECRLGEQACDDNNGTVGQCISTPIDPTSNSELCHRWADCIESGDLEACLVDGGMQCIVGLADGGQACLAASSPKLADLFGLETCSWRLIGNIQQGAWNVGLRLAGTDDPITSSLDTCDGQLVVTESGLLPHLVVLEATVAQATQQYLVLLDPQRTGCDPQLGSDMECTVAP